MCHRRSAAHPGTYICALGATASGVLLRAAACAAWAADPRPTRFLVLVLVPVLDYVHSGIRSLPSTYATDTYHVWTERRAWRGMVWLLACVHHWLGDRLPSTKSGRLALCPMFIKLLRTGYA